MHNIPTCCSSLPPSLLCGCAGGAAGVFLEGLGDVAGGAGGEPGIRAASVASGEAEGGRGDVGCSV